MFIPWESLLYLERLIVKAFKIIISALDSRFGVEDYCLNLI